MTRLTAQMACSESVHIATLFGISLKVVMDKLPVEIYPKVMIKMDGIAN